MSQTGVGLQELKKIKSYIIFIFTYPKFVGFMLVQLTGNFGMPMNRCGDVHSNIVLMAGISSKPQTTVSENQELRYQRTRTYGIKELGVTVSKN